MPTLTYPHWRDVPDQAWRWSNFSPAEIACRGTGAIKINTEAMNKLQALRDRLGKPLIVRLAYRSPEHNRAAGGAPASKHMLGTTFDIAMSNHDPAAFQAEAWAVGFLGFGYYHRSGFMHIDLGPARSWGDPFPERPVPFAPELPPAREVLSESSTQRGGGAAGASLNGLMPEREAMPSTARCSTPPPAALMIVTLWLSGCAMAVLRPALPARRWSSTTPRIMRGRPRR